MNRRFVFLLLLVAGAMLLPFRSPAPLYYTPGEGWYYEPYGEKADWQRPRAKDQLDVAEAGVHQQKLQCDAPRGASHRARVAAVRLRAARRISHRSLPRNGRARTRRRSTPTRPSSRNIRTATVTRTCCGGNTKSPAAFWAANGSGCGAPSRFTARWMKRPSCSAPSSPTAPTAMSRRTRKCSIGAAREKQKDYPRGGEGLRHRRRPLLQPAGHRG